MSGVESLLRLRRFGASMVLPQRRVNKLMDSVQLIIPWRETISDMGIIHINADAEIIERCSSLAHPGNIANMAAPDLIQETGAKCILGRRAGSGR